MVVQMLHIGNSFPRARKDMATMDEDHFGIGVVPPPARGHCIMR